MEPDIEKIKNTGNILQILKNKQNNGSVIPVHVPRAKRTFNMLNIYIFYSETTYFSFYYLNLKK